MIMNHKNGKKNEICDLQWDKKDKRKMIVSFLDIYQ